MVGDIWYSGHAYGVRAALAGCALAMPVLYSWARAVVHGASMGSAWELCIWLRVALDACVVMSRCAAHHAVIIVIIGAARAVAPLDAPAACMGGWPGGAAATPIYPESREIAEMVVGSGTWCGGDLHV